MTRGGHSGDIQLFNKVETMLKASQPVGLGEWSEGEVVMIKENFQIITTKVSTHKDLFTETRHVVISSQRCK
jgi:hypothetical protein